MKYSLARHLWYFWPVDLRNGDSERNAAVPSWPGRHEQRPQTQRCEKPEAREETLSAALGKVTSSYAALESL